MMELRLYKLIISKRKEELIMKSINYQKKKVKI